MIALLTPHLKQRHLRMHADIYTTRTGKALFAPVCPPTHVIKKALDTNAPVYWGNGPMLYKTELVEDQIVTYLCKESPKPAAGWLYEEEQKEAVIHQHDLVTRGA